MSCATLIVPPRTRTLAPQNAGCPTPPLMTPSINYRPYRQGRTPMKRVSRPKHKSLLASVAIVGASIATFRYFKRKARFAFSAKTAVVTGGSRGLGLLISRELIRRGARVAILARNSDELHRAETALRRQGGHVLALQCDVTDPQQVANAIQRVRKELGEIHITCQQCRMDWRWADANHDCRGFPTLLRPSLLGATVHHAGGSA